MHLIIKIGVHAFFEEVHTQYMQCVAFVYRCGRVCAENINVVSFGAWPWRVRTKNTTSVPYQAVVTSIGDRLDYTSISYLPPLNASM